MPSYFKLNNGLTTINEDDIVILEFTGSRWVGIKIEQGISMLDNEELLLRELEFHSFWQHASDNETIIISDPTMGSDPLKVDFYKIGERVEGSGPFGVLHPLQDPRGSGIRFVVIEVLQQRMQGTVTFIHIIIRTLDNKFRRD